LGKNYVWVNEINRFGRVTSGFSKNLRELTTLLWYPVYGVKLDESSFVSICKQVINNFYLAVLINFYITLKDK